jgi:hypothetical protein
MREAMSIEREGEGDEIGWWCSFVDCTNCTWPTVTLFFGDGGSAMDGPARLFVLSWLAGDRGWARGVVVWRSAYQYGVQSRLLCIGHRVFVYAG